MYHLRLNKALSYEGGAIKATREHPDVYTDDEAAAIAAVASGYFDLIEIPTEATADDPLDPGPLANNPPSDPDAGDPDGDPEAGCSGDSCPVDPDAQQSAAPSDEPDTAPAADPDAGDPDGYVDVTAEDSTPDFDTLATMTKAELLAFAKERDIDIPDKATRKDDILAAISVHYGGSYTMIDLLKE